MDHSRLQVSGRAPPWTELHEQGCVPRLDAVHSLTDVMNAHDPFVDGLRVGAMEGNVHTESKGARSSLRLMCRGFCFLQIVVSLQTVKDYFLLVQQPRSQDVIPQEHLMLGTLKSSDAEQGLRTDEMGSSDILDVMVFNLGNLACQTIQHQAEPRMLRLIMNQTSHIMMHR